MDLPQFFKKTTTMSLHRYVSLSATQINMKYEYGTLKIKAMASPLSVMAREVASISYSVI